MSSQLMRRHITQGATAILVTIFALSMGMGGVAVAEPRTGLLQFSNDGVTWAEDPSPVPGWKGTLVPGKEINRTYYVRNNDSVPGEFTVEVGEYSVGKYGIFSVRSDVDNVVGPQFVYYGESQTSHLFGPEVNVGTVLARVVLAPGQIASVTDRIGIPSEVGNETKNQSLTPAIGWDFLINEDPDVPTPPPGCDIGSSGSGSGRSSTGAFGSESGSISGSSEIFGFFCGIAGSSSGSTSFGS